VHLKHKKRKKKTKIRYNRHNAHHTPSSATAPEAPCGLFFLCKRGEIRLSWNKGGREGVFGGGGEEVKTRGIRIYSLHNLSPPQTHLSASLSHCLSSSCSFMFLHWHLSSFMSVTRSPPQSFCLPLTIRHGFCFSQTNLSPPQAPSFLYAM